MYPIRRVVRLAAILAAPLTLLLPATGNATIIKEVTRMEARAEIATESGIVDLDFPQLHAAFGDVMEGNSVEATNNYTSPQGGTHFDTRAFQNSDGISQLRYEGLAADGNANKYYYINVSTLIHYKFTNDSSEYQSLEFDFSLSNMMLKVQGAHQTGNPFTSDGDDSGGIALRVRIADDSAYDTNFWTYGNESELFGADFELWSTYINGDVGYDMQTGRNRTFSPNVNPLQDPGSAFVAGYEVTFDNIANTLDLGVLAPGESTTVSVGARIDVISSDIEPIFEGRFNDPNGILGDVRATPTTLTASIPEPGTNSMILAGLGMLWLVRRRAAKQTPRA